MLRMTKFYVVLLVPLAVFLFEPTELSSTQAEVISPELYNFIEFCDKNFFFHMTTEEFT